MKTNVLRIVCFAFSFLMMSAVSSKAQTAYYDTKNEKGKVVSRIKYVLGKDGASVAESAAKYTYSKKGELLEKEVYVWNQNAEASEPNHNFNDRNWTPQYCFQHNRDSISNFVTIELLIWNKKRKTYNNPARTTIYHLNASGLYDYLAFIEDGKYVERINTINDDKELLAQLANKLSKIGSVTPNKKLDNKDF